MDEKLPWHVDPLASIPKPKRRTKRPNPARRRPRVDTAARDAHLEDGRPRTLHLQYSHNLNGHVYGPGTVTVPTVLARELSSQEYQVKRGEEQFYSTKAGIIGPRDPRTGSHRVVMVPIEAFDAHLVDAVPIAQVSGLGVPPGDGGQPQF